MWKGTERTSPVVSHLHALVRYAEGILGGGGGCGGGDGGGGGGGGSGQI